MSYILDALKKSEEERKKGDLPGLQTYTPTAGAPSGKRVWVVVVIVLVATNIIGLFIWAPWQTATVLVKENVPPRPRTQHINAPSIPVRQRPADIEPVAQVIVKPVVKPVPSKFTVKPKAEPVVEPLTQTTAEPVAQLPSQDREAPASEVKISPRPQEEYREQATPSTAYLPQVSELPQSIQAQIPDLTFSSHMYSSQERFRSITINGKRLKQGRYYSDKLYVNEITEKGAIMGFEGTLFEVDVLGQWGN
ncbi:MAG: general secretion pathway protein GspB [Pseudomonadales bacterium]|nr:general secretion pathway protein GspB [Pseudomonadales bacterium]